MESNYETTPADSETLEVPEAAPQSVILYASSQRRAAVVTSLFGLGILLSIAIVAFNVHRYQLMDRILRNEGFTERDIEISDNLQFFLDIAWLVWYISTVVAFLMWTHRVHWNLPALGATNLKFNPRNAVGWYFAPLLNLFRPYQVMREIYNASDPATFVDGSSDWRSRNAPAVVKMWWTLFLIMGFVGNAVSRESIKADTPLAYQDVAAMSVVDETFSIAAMLAATWLVRSIARRQEARATLLGLS